MVKVVVMDGGGVVLSAVPNPMLKELAKRYDDPQVKHMIESAHTRNPHAWSKIKTDKNCTEEEYWKLLLEGIAIRESCEELGLMVRESIKVFDDILQVAKDLKNQGVIVGMLTNHANDWIAYVTKKFKLHQVFDPKMLVVSQELGCDKPSQLVYEKLYQRICDHAGHQIEKFEIVFIDDKKTNVVAAQEFGFLGFQFNNLKETAEDMRKRLEGLASNSKVI